MSEGTAGVGKGGIGNRQGLRLQYTISYRVGAPAWDLDAWGILREVLFTKVAKRNERVR